MSLTSEQERDAQAYRETFEGAIEEGSCRLAADILKDARDYGVNTDSWIKELETCIPADKEETDV